MMTGGDLLELQQLQHRLSKVEFDLGEAKKERDAAIRRLQELEDQDRKRARCYHCGR